ncbi:hypothetical protein GS539_18700 [Rhodococcus hoagii]|nr:hypothetical protein [Prescottella equi]
MGVQEFTTSTPTGRTSRSPWRRRTNWLTSADSKATPTPIRNDAKAELREALDAWVLSGAIKKYREAKHVTAGSKAGKKVYRHHTMLVHEETSNAAHSDAAALVRSLWNTGKFTSGEGLSRLVGCSTRTSTR